MSAMTDLRLICNVCLYEHVILESDGKGLAWQPTRLRIPQLSQKL